MYQGMKNVFSPAAALGTDRAQEMNGRLHLRLVVVPVEVAKQDGRQVGTPRSTSLKTVTELTIRLSPPRLDVCRHSRPMMSAPSVWKSCSARVL
jgi:hypothetical protein